MPEYMNPNNHTVHLTGPDGQAIRIGAGQRRTLPDFFDRYCSKNYLRRISQEAAAEQAPIRRISVTGRRTPTPGPSPAPPAPARVMTPGNTRRVLGVQREKKEVPQKASSQKRIVKQVPPPKQARVVGRRLNENATKILHENVSSQPYPISNNIGIGILSYNRPDSLRRLVESIKKYTNLRRTTVFISDDASSNQLLRLYLDELANQKDIVVLKNAQRLGVAGNSNRLLRCLSRFKTCLLLNDDVEVLADGWDSFYADALDRGIIKHFCMRQPGVYGAKAGEHVTIGGINMTRVPDKPHGAIIAYTNEVVDKIGYFDEKFGVYGMEHVDWSMRAWASGLQPNGYYDLESSTSYFRIHNERSAVEDRERHLGESRRTMSTLDAMRGYVSPSPRSAVPAMSCVIPCRDLERHGAIATVIAGIKAQRFPSIEIIVVEHDSARRVPNTVNPVRHMLVDTDQRPFNKAKAFNNGVAAATAPYLLLHDADLITPGDYMQDVYNTLQTHEACHFGKTVLYLSKDSSSTVNKDGVVDTSMACDAIVGYFEGGSIGCRRGTYWRVGGFHEGFWGYGVEDCEFYDRLSNNCNWNNDRKYDFVHLWHGRSDTWQQEHKRNKEFGHLVSNKDMAQRIQDRYGELRNEGHSEHLELALKGMI